MTVISCCPDCTHFHPNQHYKTGEALRCEAFPDGIPNDVLFDTVDRSGKETCNNEIGFKSINEI